MRARLLMVVSLSFALTACPLALSDWTIAGGGPGEDGGEAGSGSDAASSDAGVVHDALGAEGCTIGTLGCDDAQPTICTQSGYSPVGQSCGAWCVDGKCVQCKPGATSCAPSGGGVVQTCTAVGQWANTTTCPTGICFGGACVVCDVSRQTGPSWPTCNGGVQQWCVSGQWVEFSCDAGCATTGEPYCGCVVDAGCPSWQPICAGNRCI